MIRFNAKIGLTACGLMILGLQPAFAAPPMGMPMQPAVAIAPSDDSGVKFLTEVQRLMEEALRKYGNVNLPTDDGTPLDGMPGAPVPLPPPPPTVPASAYSCPTERAAYLAADKERSDYSKKMNREAEAEYQAMTLAEQDLRSAEQAIENAKADISAIVQMFQFSIDSYDRANPGRELKGVSINGNTSPQDIQSLSEQIEHAKIRNGSPDQKAKELAQKNALLAMLKNIQTLQTTLTTNQNKLQPLRDKVKAVRKSNEDNSKERAAKSKTLDDAAAALIRLEGECIARLMAQPKS